MILKSPQPLARASECVGRTAHSGVGPECGTARQQGRERFSFDFGRDDRQMLRNGCEKPRDAQPGRTLECGAGRTKSFRLRREIAKLPRTFIDRRIDGDEGLCVDNFHMGAGAKPEALYRANWPWIAESGSSSIEGLRA